ncbi:MAG TPA: alpha-hydroxy acid oxidase, partial [Gammaproteobacteria bacterium]|nr:alpha-hydroxy acid oxidase [Gammaproteobacteria bacterium]
MSRGLERCYNVARLRERAKRRLPAPMFHYIDGAAGDEWTMRQNTAAFDRWELVPRWLVDVSQIDLSTTVFGQKIDVPFFCAPTAMSRLFHHVGEPAVARAAQRIGTMYSLSSISTTSIEEAAAATSGPKLFQVYVFKDRGLNREFVARCKAAGYSALALTVDVPVAGNRERDIVTGMTIPPKLTLASLFDFAMHPRWVWNYFRSPPIELANVRDRIKGDVTTLVTFFNDQLDRTVNWDDAAWMAEEWGGPFAIKGVLSVEDAKRAAEIGATAVMVSNHGGRQLDTSPAPIEVLPEIVDEVGDKVEVILEGGVRRGVHVLKALALGAKAVSFGRPYLYALGAGGEAGVDQVLNFFRTDIERDMRLLGCR